MNVKVYFFSNCKECSFVAHESCKEHIKISCFNIQKRLKKKIEERSNIGKEAIDTDSAETITTSNNLLSCITLNDNNLEKMEDVMTEIFDSELKYTQDMNSTSKVRK
jgi:hypothetical protein